MSINLIYITAGDIEEARALGKALVSERLVACVNIIDNIHSIYWWEGKIQDDGEVIIIAKTKKSLVAELIEKVKSMHNYDCPCVVSLPIVDGNKEFLGWVEKETRPGKPDHH